MQDKLAGNCFKDFSVRPKYCAFEGLDTDVEGLQT